MDNNRRRAAGIGTAVGGAGMFHAAVKLPQIEARHNARLQVHNDERRAAIAKPFGYSPTGEPVEDPRARARAAQFPPTREHKRLAREAVKAKHRKLAEFEASKPRGIPLNAQAGRRWALVGLGGAALWGGARATVDKRVTRDDVDRAGLGAGLGVGFYQAPHYASKPIDRRDERRIAMDDDLRHLNRKHKDRIVPHGADLGHPSWERYFRTMPLELPGARRKRIFSHTHAGRSGAALNIGAAMIGAGTAVGHGRSRQKVAKALYQRESRLSPVRTLEFGAGAGVAAWGLGRSPMVGRALSRGVRLAAQKDNARATEALQLAMAARGVLARGTAPAERQLRQIQRVNAAIEAVPSSIRPELAVAAGALLAGHAMPVRRTSYRPVSQQVTMRGPGW